MEIQVHIVILQTWVFMIANAYVADNAMVNLIEQL